MKSGRREFLKGVAMTAGASCVAGAAAGCATKGVANAGEGAPMRNFRCAPMDRVRVGVVGLGARGSSAVNRLLTVPGVEVAAVCDIRPGLADKAVAAVVEKTGVKPAAFSGGADEFMRLCDLPQVDVVYNCTSWNAHARVSLRAMECGKHTLVEVPSALTIDECWAFVETAERTKRHCMQLENCCYGEQELLALNLCKLGLLGELLHGEGAYIHDRRWQIFNDSQWERWRNHWNEAHAGNQYPTHGLGPIALDMGINRGDRFDYLVSVDGVQRGYEAFAAATMPAGSPARAQRFAMADMNVTTIRTALGRTIMLQHDVTSPRPYSRLNLIAGTKGVLRGYPRLEICLEGADEWPTTGGHHSFKDEKTEEIRARYMHPLQKALGELAKRDGGHGGMDFVMDFRWSYCMRRGLPLDMDVYDLASWCAVCELSERSARGRSAPVDFPDFTRGAWKAKSRCNLMDADVPASELLACATPSAAARC